MSETATLELLIQIRDELAGLNRTKQALADTKKQGEGLGALFRQGLGIGTGMQIAASGIALLRGSLQETVGEAFRLAGEIKDGSEALGITGEAYQVIKSELAAAGLEMGRFEMAVSSQTQSLAQARTGAGAAAEAYKMLGLSAAELEALSPDERVLAVVRAITEATDRNAAFSAGAAVLGERQLPRLVSGLRAAALNFRGVKDEAIAANRVMTGETAAALDQAEKNWKKLKTSMVIATGESLGFWDKIRQSAGKDFLGTYAAMQMAPLYWTGIMKSDPLGALFNRTIPKPKEDGTPNVISNVTREDVLNAQLARWQQAAADLSGNPLKTEIDQRRELLPILRAQAAVYKELIDLKVGDVTTPDAGDTLITKAMKGNLTEAELARYKTYIQLLKDKAEVDNQATRAAGVGVSSFKPISQAFDQFQKGKNPEGGNLLSLSEGMQAGYMNFLMKLGSEGERAAALLEQSLGQALSSIGNDIWEAAKGTEHWSEMFTHLGDIAGRMLSQMIAQMVVLQTLNMALGIFGYGVVSGPMGATIGKIKAAGGGTFLTRGPTHFTVGDNPGGIELVQVTPLSGIGTSTVNGMALRMAGGGSALVASGGATGGISGGTFYIDNSNADAAGIARLEATLRALNGSIEHRALSAAFEAKRRRIGGFR